MDDVTLTRLICAHLGTLPGWQWSEADDPYPPIAIGVFYGAIGSEPDRAVGVRIYSTTDDELSTRRVQLRLRGERGRPDGADMLSDVAFPIMLTLTALPGISTITRLSMAPAGADGNRREERTENYLITLDNKETLHA